MVVEKGKIAKNQDNCVEKTDADNLPFELEEHCSPVAHHITGGYWCREHSQRLVGMDKGF